jgi:hypothetical protein
MLVTGIKHGKKMMFCIELLVIMITAALKAAIPDDPARNKTEKLIENRLSGKKVTFAHG